MTKGEVGVWNGPKKDDVIYEQPLIQIQSADNDFFYSIYIRDDERYGRTR